jgi:hypothetical protein
MGPEVTMPESGNADIDQRLARLEQQAQQRENARLRGQQRPAKARQNWDGYTAVIATLIGLLALGVSGYTAYVQRQQLRAQVWPHIEVETSNVAPSVGHHIVNSGTGPARVTAVRVTVDNKPVASWAHALKAMSAGPGGVVTSQISNTVVPAGKDVTIIRPYDEATTARFEQLFLGDGHEIVVTICYCSVLDECWVAKTNAAPDAMPDPAACPIPSADRFTQ